MLKTIRGPPDYRKSGILLELVYFWIYKTREAEDGPVRGPPDYRKSGIPLELIYNVPGAVAEFWGPVGL